MVWRGLVDRTQKKQISLNSSQRRRYLMSKTLTLSEAKAWLSELVAAVEQTEEELVITRNGSEC